jgi:hypothetical protein
MRSNDHYRSSERNGSLPGRLARAASSPETNAFKDDMR